MTASTAAVNAGLGVVAVLVAVSMVLGAVDLLRKPGWAWKAAGEPKVMCLVLVLLLPGVGLAVYVFGARPRVVALVAAGRAASLPFERFTDRDALSVESTRAIQALALPTSLGSFGERRNDRGLRASEPVARPASPGGGFFDDPDLVVVGTDGPAAGSSRPVPVPVPADAVAPKLPGGLGRPYRPRQRASLDETGPLASVVGPTPGSANRSDPRAPIEPTARSSGHRAPVTVPSAGAAVARVPVVASVATAPAPEIFRPDPVATAPLAAEGASDIAPVATLQARWMSDPTGRHQYRYWDGGSWTENVYDAGVESRDPVADR